MAGVEGKINALIKRLNELVLDELNPPEGLFRTGHVETGLVALSSAFADSADSLENFERALQAQSKETLASFLKKIMEQYPPFMTESISENFKALISNVLAYDQRWKTDPSGFWNSFGLVDAQAKNKLAWLELVKPGISKQYENTDATAVISAANAGLQLSEKEIELRGKYNELKEQAKKLTEKRRFLKKGPKLEALKNWLSEIEEFEKGLRDLPDDSKIKSLHLAFNDGELMYQHKQTIEGLVEKQSKKKKEPKQPTTLTASKTATIAVPAGSMQSDPERDTLHDGILKFLTDKKFNQDYNLLKAETTQELHIPQSGSDKKTAQTDVRDIIKYLNTISDLLERIKPYDDLVAGFEKQLREYFSNMIKWTRKKLEDSGELENYAAQLQEIEQAASKKDEFDSAAKALRAAAEEDEQKRREEEEWQREADHYYGDSEDESEEGLEEQRQPVPSKKGRVRFADEVEGGRLEDVHVFKTDSSPLTRPEGQEDQSQPQTQRSEPPQPQLVVVQTFDPSNPFYQPLSLREQWDAAVARNASQPEKEQILSEIRQRVMELLGRGVGQYPDDNPLNLAELAGLQKILREQEKKPAQPVVRMPQYVQSVASTLPASSSSGKWDIRVEQDEITISAEALKIIKNTGKAFEFFKDIKEMSPHGRLVLLEQKQGPLPGWLSSEVGQLMRAYNNPPKEGSTITITGEELGQCLQNQTKLLEIMAHKTIQIEGYNPGYKNQVKVYELLLAFKRKVDILPNRLQPQRRV